MPSEIQQLIGVDYRALKDSQTAQALKDKLLPENLKDSEEALKGIGIDCDRDLDQLDVASFRTEKKGIQTVFVAPGSFSAKVVLKKLKLKKIAATKYGTTNIYPMGSGLVMTFLDDNTLAFGDASVFAQRARYPRRQASLARFQFGHDRPDDGSRRCAGLEHPRPEGNPGHYVLGDGRCRQGWPTTKASRSAFWPPATP